MSEYIEALGSDEGIGMEQILREAERDTASWKCNDMPGTETLRRMILLADWASMQSLKSILRFDSNHDLSAESIRKQAYYTSGRKESQAIRLSPARFSCFLHQPASELLLASGPPRSAE